MGKIAGVSGHFGSFFQRNFGNFLWDPAGRQCWKLPGSDVGQLRDFGGKLKYINKMFLGESE